MKASSLTLGDVLNLLPLTLKRRYDPAKFAPGAANEVLADIEKCDSDLLVGETGILLVEGVTDYRLPDSVRQIKGLYLVPAGDVVPDIGHPVAHEFFKDRIRLAETPTMSDDDDISGTVSISAPSDKTLLYHLTAFADLDEDALISRLAKVTHANGVVEYAILKGNSTTEANINGELVALATAGDTFLVTSNYMLLQHQRYLARVPTGAAADATVIDIPQDFDYLFRAGMFFRYHAQSDSLSKETKFWEAEYLNELEKFNVDTSKGRGTTTRNAPRSIPTLFS